ncbi:hypothetical protein [Kitasatospora sp. NPDC088346]|uniref:hypothetical protein n=1 Tax=Kitasatospora sp. NPDC088346 TaxID=3364073 RepID=UPI003829ECAF
MPPFTLVLHDWATARQALLTEGCSDPGQPVSSAENVLELLRRHGVEVVLQESGKSPHQ